MSIELLIHKGRNGGVRDWNLGDVVIAKQVPCTWGLEEVPPNFYIVTITGVNLDNATVQTLLEPHQMEPFVTPQGETVQRLRVRRRWSISVADIPAAIRTSLQTTGRATVTAGQVANFLAAIRER